MVMSDYDKPLLDVSEAHIQGKTQIYNYVGLTGQRKQRLYLRRPQINSRTSTSYNHIQQPLKKYYNIAIYGKGHLTGCGLH